MRDPETDVISFEVDVPKKAKNLKDKMMNKALGSIDLPLSGLTRGVENSFWKPLNEVAQIHIGFTPVTFGKDPPPKKKGKLA